MEKTLKIEGMMCMHCAGRVKKALEAVPGVTGAGGSGQEAGDRDAGRSGRGSGAAGRGHGGGLSGIARLRRAFSPPGSRYLCARRRSFSSERPPFLWQKDREEPGRQDILTCLSAPAARRGTEA